MEPELFKTSLASRDLSDAPDGDPEEIDIDDADVDEDEDDLDGDNAGAADNGEEELPGGNTEE